MIQRPLAPLSGWCVQAARWTEIGIALIAIVVMIGWQLGLPALQLDFGLGHPLRPNAALGFLALGVALALDAHDGHGSRAPRLAHLAAALAVGLGLAALLEYVSGIDLALDSLPVAREATFLTGADTLRMPPATAISVILLGAGVLSRDARTPLREVSTALTLAAMLLGSSIVLGYAQGIEKIYGGSTYGTVSLTAGLLMILTGVARLAARPSGPLVSTLFAPHTGGMLARRIVPLAIAIPLVLGFIALLGQRTGWYGTDFGLLLVTVATVAIVAAIGALAARSLAQIERRRSAAEQSTLRLLQSLDQAQEALITLDLGARVTGWSEGATRLYGYQLHEVIGRFAPDLLVPESAPQDRAHVLERVRLLSGQAYEAVRRTNAGRLVDVEISYVPIRDEDGEVVGQLSVSRDIGERKRAQQMQAHAAAIVESSDDAIIGTSLDGTITSWNGGAQRLFGYAFEEILGKPIYVLLESEQNAEEDDLRRRVGAGESVAHFDTTRLHRSGRAVAVSLTASPIRNEDGLVVGVSKIARDITERKRAVAALASERALLRTLIDALPDVVFTKDIAGRFGLCNQAALAHMGMADEDEIGGRTVFDLYPRELAQRFHDDDMAVLAGDALMNREEPSLDASGQERWFLTTKVPLLDGAGEVVGLVGISRDITERRRMEQSLRESESRFRDLAESLPQLVWTCSAVGECDYISQQWVQYTGADMSTQLGTGWLAQIHPDDRPGLMQSWQTAVARGTSFRIEFRIRRHDGAWRWFDTRAVPLRDEAGRVTKWLGSNTDVHEARAMREALQQQALLLELAHDPIFVWDPQTGIVFWNRGSEQLYGYAREEALGRSSHELLRTVFPESLAAFREALDRNQEWSGELQHTTKEGRLVTVVSRHQKVMLGGRSVVLETNRDMTDRKRSEERELRSQKMEALGTLAGGIAHDFNNVLLAIAGNARLAMQELPGDHPAQFSLGEIDKASARASDLVRRILSFTRQQESRRAPVSLPAAIEEAVQLMRATLPAMIEIRYKAPAGSPTILADATQIHQLVMNLVTNAAHAIGQRRGVIELRVDDLEVTTDMAGFSTDLRAGHYARLSVCDDGSGMDKATLDRIFDPFFTTKPVGMGTGLGLSTVHGIVKAHEGAVSVYSALGKGTIFHVYLPVADQAALSPPVRPAQAPAGSGERILYVDDEAALVHLATRMLGRLGYQVETHTDPTEAVGAFRARPEHYDAVVTDLSMPRMSGFELARAVLEIRPDIPVVMTSGYLREEDHEHAVAIGIREVILKPSTAEDLSHVLHRLLGQLRPQSG